MGKGIRVEQEKPRPHILAVGATATVLIVGLGGWAVATYFAASVIAPGQPVINADVKTVRHPTGGTVSELLVRDGDRVKDGDVLLRLDDPQTRAQLAIVTKSLDELAARQARAEAERDGLDAVAFPQTLLARLSDPDVAKAVHGELQQFDMRRAESEGERSQLRQRIAQLTEELRGHEAQIASKSSQVGSIKKNLNRASKLGQKGLVRSARLTALKRDKERLQGERGQLIAALAQTKGRITDTELQIQRIERDMHTEVGKNLSEIRAKTVELVAKKMQAEASLKPVDIRAPLDGVVHQLAVHAVGVVIGPGDVIMLIVPDAGVLAIEPTTRDAEHRPVPRDP